MNWAHVHLMINHLPVIGIPGIILLMAYALIRKSDEVKMVSLGLVVLMALATLAVYFTGDGAADVVKKIPGVQESFIERHEEIADLSLVLVEVLGAIALGGLFLLRRKGSIPTFIVVIVLVLSLFTAAVLGVTANFGGQIRHTEIRDPAQSSPVPAAEQRGHEENH